MERIPLTKALTRTFKTKTNKTMKKNYNYSMIIAVAFS